MTHLAKFGVAILVLCLTLGMLGGCGVLDAFFGVKPDGTRESGGGPAGVVGGIVDLAVPGASLAVGALGALWAAIRGKRWKDAALATFETIEHGARVGKSVADLKEDLADAHLKAGVYKLVEKAVDRYPHEPEPAAIPAS